MGLFLIFLNILCAVLFGISAYASYIAGLTGRASINLLCCICWVCRFQRSGYCAAYYSVSFGGKPELFVNSILRFGNNYGRALLCGAGVLLYDTADDLRFFP